MNAVAITAPNDSPSNATLQHRFLAVLPQIESRARSVFRDLACAQRRADAIADTVALAWRWFVALAHRGKDATRFISALATLASRAVRGGRRVAGRERARDALSSVGQARHHFHVGRLPDISTLSGNAWDEALADNRRSAVPDQVCFRMDFPRWRRRQTLRNRGVIDDLVVGERTSAVAQRHGLTSARISQLRRTLHDDWQQFCGE